MPPSACASAMMWWTSVVFPEDSGPKISMIRPRGTPPTPSARSRESAPVGIASISIASWSPRRMSDPWPNWRSIWVFAAWSAASFAFASLSAALSAAFKFAFFSCVISSSPFFCEREIQLGESDVFGAGRPQIRAVERQSRAFERLHERSGERLRRRLDPHGLPAPAASAGSPLRAHSSDGHMGPELALRGLVDPLGGEPVRELGLKLDRRRALPLHRK